jgi:L-fucose mutarotase
MLKGIDPLIPPDLLHVLALMGHGDQIAIVDANFPAASVARRLIGLAGVSAPRALQALLSLLPIDTFEPDPTRVMAAVDASAGLPGPVKEFMAILEAAGLAPPVPLERHGFYAAAAGAFAVVQTGERRFYGNILLTKGVIPPEGGAP